MNIKYKSIWMVVLAIVLPILLWTVWGFWGVGKLASWYGKDKLEGLGLAGDLFGGVNALFAAFAFGGVAIAAYFQYRTLKTTQEAQALASFEPLFFKLLERHDRMYAELRLELRQTIKLSFPGGNEGNPKELTFWLRRQVATGDHISIGAVHTGVQLKESDFEWVKINFEDLYVANEDVLGPFYRTTYHLFNLIDKSTLSEGEKIRYANIARSAIDRDELLMLMLNCLHVRGASMKALIERYGVLKHISTDKQTNALDVAVAKHFFHPNAMRSAEDRASHSIE